MHRFGWKEGKGLGFTSIRREGGGSRDLVSYNVAELERRGQERRKGDYTSRHCTFEFQNRLVDPRRGVDFLEEKVDSLSVSSGTP